MLRTDVLALLLFERLQALGPSPEAEVVEALDSRAPGRGYEVLTLATQRGMIRRVVHADEPVAIEAAGRPK